jgi:hypothetical protein
LSRIVHKLLAKKPEDRYQSAAQMLRDLRLVPMDGVAEWQAADEDWNTVEWEMLATSKMAATQKLSTVMMRETKLAPQWRWIAALLVFTLGAFLAGTGLAWLSRPTYLLNVDEGELPQVEKKENVKAQFDHAMSNELATERDWLAVEKYFPSEADPQNAEYIRKSRLMLAYYYDANERQDEALKILDELTTQESDNNLRIEALKLQVNILARMNRQNDALQKVTQLVNVMVATGRTSRQDRFDTLRELETPRLQKLFEDRFPADGSSGNGSPGRPNPAPGKPN